MAGMDIDMGTVMGMGMGKQSAQVVRGINSIPQTMLLLWNP